MDEPTRLTHGRSLAGNDLAAFALDDDSNDSWISELRAAETLDGLGQIGPYELLEEVGRGGQGVVYKARQPSTKRFIALKRLAAGSWASASARRRFEREVEAVAALNHPNIVTIYGTELIEGQPLLAMEWIEGRPVDQWARLPDGGRRETNDLLAMFLNVCDAVQHAHQRGVIHRDLKPSNILVDLEGRPRLLDFGLAKLTGKDALDPQLTASDEFVGTPAYAAPEQVLFDHQAIDIRTDVYALGVVLYQMLTGHMPYEVTRDLSALIEFIQHVDPPRPSAYDRRLDRELDAIVLKALAKEPARRYPSVDALAADVRRHLAGEPVLAHPPSAIYQIRKLIRRHRAAATLTGVIALLIVAFGVTAGLLAVRERSARRLADAENLKLRQSNTFVFDLLELFGRDLPPPIVVRAKENIARAAQRMRQRLVGQGESSLDLPLLLARCYQSLGAGDEAEAGFRQSLKDRMEHFGPRSLEAAEVAVELARLLAGTQRQTEAEALLRDALDTRREKLGQTDRLTLATMNDLGAVLHAVGRLREAESLLSQALELQSRGANPYRRNLAITQNNLALVLRDSGRLPQAEALFRQALESHRMAADHEQLDLAATLNNLGNLYKMQGRFGPAITALREALQLRRAALGDGNVRVAVSALNLAQALASAGEAVEAESLLREALDTSTEILGPRHPLRATILQNLALLLDAEPAQAEPLLIEAVAIYRAAGSHHPDLANTLDTLALTLKRLGRVQEAEAARDQALAIRGGRPSDPAAPSPPAP